ncbi:MAG: major capsid protein [Trueperaceae bacterium]|nr:major capsid protein [Trueperaceae bacterium]
MEFLTPEELTPEFFNGALDESEPRHREILSLVDLEQHDGEKIEQKVIVQQHDRQASIVGIVDRFPRVRGDKVETMLIDPFHIKNAKTFDESDDELQLDGNGSPVLAAEAVPTSVSFLEKLRTNLVVNAILSAITTKAFSYASGDMKIQLDFSEQVQDLTGPQTGDWDDNANCEPYVEQDAFINEFFDNTGQVPTRVLLSGKTASKIKQLDEVAATYQKQAPRDPDVETFEEFTFDNLMYRIMRKKRLDSSGSLVDAIPEGYGVVTVDTVDETDGSPFLWHRAQTKRQTDTSRPLYRSWVDGSDEVAAISLGMQDNGIPGFAKRGIVMLYKFYTP